MPRDETNPRVFAVYASRDDEEYAREYARVLFSRTHANDIRKRIRYSRTQAGTRQELARQD